MKAELRTITPELAKQMLAANTANRPLTESNVLALAKEMKAGRWKVNGDMIRFSNEHVVIDGQHRLHAVVKSGVTIESWVMYDLPSEVFNTIDVGKRRSAGDTLSCRGHINAFRLAAALAMIDKYMTGRADKSVQYSNTEIEGLLEKYPDVSNYMLHKKNGKFLLTPSVFDCCYYLFSKKDPEMANVFVERIFKGIGLEEGDPWYVLRERLLANSISNTKLPKPLLLALCIKAWNAARQGRRVTKLQLNLIDGKMGYFPVIE